MYTFTEFLSDYNPKHDNTYQLIKNLCEKEKVLFEDAYDSMYCLKKAWFMWDDKARSLVLQSLQSKLDALFQGLSENLNSRVKDDFYFRAFDGNSDVKRGLIDKNVNSYKEIGVLLKYVGDIRDFCEIMRLGYDQRISLDQQVEKAGKYSMTEICK
jgi:hypothetical protein